MFSAQQQQQMQRTTPQAVPQPQPQPQMQQVQAQQLAPQQEQMPPQVRQAPSVSSTLMAAAGDPLAPAQQPQPQVMTAEQQHATMMMQPLANAQGVLPGGAATPQKAQQLLQRARSLASSNGLAVTQAPHIAPGQVCACARSLARMCVYVRVCVGVCWCVCARVQPSPRARSAMRCAGQAFAASVAMARHSRR